MPWQEFEFWGLLTKRSGGTQDNGTRAPLTEWMGRRRGGRENTTLTYSTTPPHIITLPSRCSLGPWVGWRDDYRAGSCEVVHHAVIVPSPCPPPSSHAPL